MNGAEARGGTTSEENGGWIRVDEQLPEHDREVWATFKGQFNWVMFIARKSRGSLVAPRYSTPTHWRELPAPPTH